MIAESEANPASSGRAPPLVSDEVRQEFVAASARDERANRPRWLLVLGLCLLAGSIIYLVYNLYRVSAAHIELAQQYNDTVEVKKSARQILALSEQGSTEDAKERTAPNPQVVAKLQGFASDLGLTFSQISETNTTDVNKTTRKRTYSASTKDQPAELLFRWLARTTEVKGLEVSMLDIRPGTGTPEGEPRWSATVLFSRYEHK